MPPGDAVSVMQTVVDCPTGQGRAIGILGAGDMPRPVGGRKPGAAAVLAVADVIVLADLPCDPRGDCPDAHRTPPCCCSQPLMKVSGPALNGFSQARATFL